MNLSATGANGWSGDGTAHSVAWLDSRYVGETDGKTYRREKGEMEVIDVVSAYNRSEKRDGKGDGDSLRIERSRGKS